MRGREFLMKDAYSFDLDEDGMNKSYQAMKECYQKIFDEIGFEYKLSKLIRVLLEETCQKNFM